MAQAFIDGRDQINPELGELWKPADMHREIQELDKLIPLLQKQAEQTNTTLMRLYYWRNALLLCGFVGFFAAKILTPYCH
jgi:hypothetical protein